MASRPLELEELLQKKSQSEFKKIFFYRICGTGMGNVAVLLKQMGYEVGGCDQVFYPPMSDYLEKKKIPLLTLSEVSEEVLRQYDLIVVGNAVGGKSDCAQKIMNCGVAYSSFPAIMGAFILHDRNVIGIAGTHGKTTTTYFMMQLLRQIGKRPGHLIGGVLNNEESVELGSDSEFVIESDEYDSAFFHKKAKFQFYCIKNLILTSLEHDHADIYPEIEMLFEQFKELFPLVSQQIIYHHSVEKYPHLQRLIEEFREKNTPTKFLDYGDDSSFGPKNVEVCSDNEGSQFSLNFESVNFVLKTNIIGAHNIENLSSCLRYLYSCYPVETRELIQKPLLLDMVKRRQEIKGKYKNALFIDDFAHHPRAVSVTIESVQNRFPGHKIIVVFAPSSATSRSDLFQQEFTESLKESFQVVLVRPENPTSVKGRKDLDMEVMQKELRAKYHRETIVVFNLEGLVKSLENFLRNDLIAEKLFLFLGNGSIYGFWSSEFSKKILQET